MNKLLKQFKELLNIPMTQYTKEQWLRYNYILNKLIKKGYQKRHIMKLYYERGN